jgi:hypothetical protein
MKRFAILLVLAAACGDDGNTPKDAPSDTGITGDGPCAGDLEFTGEYVDWDSKEADFCGVFNAKFAVHSDPTRMAKTAPNGRFILCMANAATTQVDITPPASSQCAGPTRSYTIPGIAIANRDVIASGKLFSAREISMERLTPFYAQFGLTYDPAKAGVFVHVEGSAHPVAITGTHDTTLAYDGTTWAAGIMGEDVFFPNVTIGGGTTMVTAGGATGEDTVPIAAGTITYVTLIR